MCFEDHLQEEHALFTNITPPMSTLLLLSTYTTKAKVDVNTFIFNSGASVSMTWNKAWLYDFQPFSHSVTLGNNTTIPVTGCRNIRAITLVDGKKVCIKLSNVYLVPALAKNLIFASHLVERGCIYTHDSSGITV